VDEAPAPMGDMSAYKQASIVRTISQFLSSLRFRLVLLVILASLPPVALTLRIARQDRQRQAAALRQRSHDMIQLAARNEDEMIAATRQLLRAVAESSQVQSAQWDACTRLLRTLSADYPRYANLGVIRTNGEVAASAVPMAGPVNLADRSFFQRALATRDLSIGNYQVGRITGKPSVNLGYPVLDPSGQIQAVVFAALDLDSVNGSDYAIQTLLPARATWTKIDRNGTILVRYPKTDKRMVGEPLPNMSLLKTFLARKDRVMEVRDPKGFLVFYDSTSTRASPVTGDVISILSIPSKVLFAEPDHLVAFNLTCVGIVAGLMLVIGLIGSQYVVLRPIRALMAFTTRLEAGDNSARTGLRGARNELRQLTSAVDQMAESLQRRETERNQAEEELKKSRKRLQALSRRLVEVQETERRHLARELHDEIGQGLTAAEMNLQAILQSPGTDAQARRLRESLEVVERVQEQVHDLSLKLRPSMLDDLGLESALRWYANRQAALAGLKAEVRADPLDQRLDPIIETECFRVAQEALTNVVKHAKARTVIVELTHHDDQLHLSVRDDGVGFEVASVRAQAVRGASLGLLSMEERTTLAGGGLQYHAAPGQGTEVHAWFPLKWAQPAVLVGATSSLLPSQES
jgi:signal transduction histidine kinase